MSFLDELQRRSVIRVAIGYLAGAWLLIQILETLFPIFGIPETSIRLVVIIAAIGFVPVLVASWSAPGNGSGMGRAPVARMMCLAVSSSVPLSVLTSTLPFAGSVAAPIKDAEGYAIAALNIAVPTKRVGREVLVRELAPLAMRCAKEIEFFSRGQVSNYPTKFRIKQK